MNSRVLALLAALAAALAAAFVVAPRALTSGFADIGDLVTALRAAFVGYWKSGDSGFPPDLEKVVDYWSRYHLAKAVIAAVLLAALVALGLLLWKAFLRAGRGAGLASAGVLVTMLALCSLVLVMANVQGAVAPFASLLPMLVAGTPSGRLAATLDDVRQRLAESMNGSGQAPPALEVMISDFALYHEAFAVIGAIVAVVLVGLSVVAWRRFSRTESSERRTRRVLGSFGTLSALVSVAVILVAAANTTTAADAAPGLMAFFEGGW